MKNIFKIIALSSVTSTLLLGSDIALDSIGVNLGKGYTDHYQEDHIGKIEVARQPYKNFTGLEVYSTFNGVFQEDDLKPYLSFTYLTNEDMNHIYLLAGINKYYYLDHLDLHGGIVAGYGQLEWNYNPINNTRDNNYDANSFLVGLQGGVEYPLNDSLSLGLNAKYLLHDYETQLEPSDDAASTISHDKTLFIAVGLSYKFGEEPPKDSDNDGVIDKIDQCPNSTEGEDVNNQGCPKDSDNDGIYDHADECPNTLDGMHVDSKGCSCTDYDDDNDGVDNCTDKCPNTPENNEVDQNGCLLDSDKDGILDINDSCPNSQENEIVNEQGCAKDTDKDGVIDRLDKCSETPNDFTVDKNGCMVSFMLRVNFPTNSAVIDQEYYKKINKLSDYIFMLPEHLILIEAHTDSRGSEEYNQKLSKKRAKALYDHLIAMGISEDRLAYSGLGETIPMATNDSEEGRALNRRIEVTFIKKP